jgi:hypothetical protein
MVKTKSYYFVVGLITFQYEKMNNQLTDGSTVRDKENTKSLIHSVHKIPKLQRTQLKISTLFSLEKKATVVLLALSVMWLSVREGSHQ